MGTCLQTNPNEPMKLVEQKAFCLVSKGVQWQAKFACLSVLTCVMMVGEVCDSCPIANSYPHLLYSFVGIHNPPTATICRNHWVQHNCIL